MYDGSIESRLERLKKAGMQRSEVEMVERLLEAENVEEAEAIMDNFEVSEIVGRK